MDGTKLNAANVALVYSGAVLVVKLIVMVASGSLTVISETIDVIVDLMLVGVLRIVIRVSARKPDVDHTYGHGKFEGVGSIVQATIISIVYTIIIYNAIHAIINDELPEITEGFVAILVFSCLIISNVIAGGWLVKKGKVTRSSALHIHGMNYLFDGVRSIVVIAALTLSIIGIPVADAIFAIVLSVLVIGGSFACNKEAVENLLEKNPLTREEMAGIYDLSSHVNDITDVKDLRVKRVGDTICITMTILMNPSATLKEAHDKTEEIEAMMQHIMFSGKDIVVSIHVQDA